MLARWAERPVVTETAQLVGAIEGGGTKFVCAVGISPLQILDRVIIPTTDPSTTLAACAQFFTQMTQRHGRIAALGLACFGPLQLRRDAPDFGYLQSTPKPGWSNADVVSPLRGSTGTSGGPGHRCRSCGRGRVAPWLRTRTGFTGLCHRRHRNRRRSCASCQCRTKTDASGDGSSAGASGSARRFSRFVSVSRRLPGRTGQRPGHPRTLGKRAVFTAGWASRQIHHCRLSGPARDQHCPGARGGPHCLWRWRHGGWRVAATGASGRT